MPESKNNLSGGEEAANYTNSLKLIDSYSLNTTMDLEKVIVTGGGNLSQVSERQTVEGVPQQVVTINANTNINFDLMRIFSFGFFRPNTSGLPYHAATFFVGYDYARNMLITYNIEENVHTPRVGLTLKRDRSSLSLRTGVDYRHRTRKEYIDYEESERDRRDDVYIENMAISPSSRKWTGVTVFPRCTKPTSSGSTTPSRASTSWSPSRSSVSNTRFYSIGTIIRAPYRRSPMTSTS